MARKEMKTNFLAAYVKYAQTAVESKDEYHYACGLAALSAAVGNRCFLDTPMKKFYGDLWFLMVGPAGISRKSTAIKCMEGVLPSNFHKYPQDWTWEAFVDELVDHNCGLWIRDEFGGWLSQQQKRYMAGTTDKLRRLYDNGTMTVRTKSSGSIQVDEIALSVTLGSTPGAVAKYMNVIEELENGLLSRIVIVSGKPITFAGLWRAAPGVKKLKTALINKLVWIRKRAQAARKVTFEPSDEALIKDAYNDFFFRLQSKISKEPKMASVYQRLLDVSFKIGLLFALDEKRPLAKEQTMRIKHAIDAIEITEHYLMKWFMQGLEEIKASYTSLEADKYEMEETKLMMLMKKYGDTHGKVTTIVRSKLYKYSNIGNIDQFDSRLKSMIESGSIHALGKMGSRGIYYANTINGIATTPAGFYSAEMEDSEYAP
jgi:hypothetical protein